MTEAELQAIEADCLKPGHVKCDSCRATIAKLCRAVRERDQTNAAIVNELAEWANKAGVLEAELQEARRERLQDTAEIGLPTSTPAIHRDCALRVVEE